VVGVERLARDDAFAVHDLVVADVVHVGVAGDVTLFLVVRLKLAEQLRGRLELTWREVLVSRITRTCRSAKARASASRVSLSIGWVKSRPVTSAPV
jgi:hypothetical protein